MVHAARTQQAASILQPGNACNVCAELPLILWCRL